MHARLFTLDEANRLVPLVRSIARDAVASYRATRDAIRALQRLNARPAAPPADMERQERRIERHLEELRRLVAELDDLGCRLRDYERGAVDFPAAALDAQALFVVYCWALGDRRVTHWHSEDEGHESRRLLGVEASA
ncbi:MAG: DUF2203 domain-containing protein [Planctomycetota bacterium]|jgi:hypothetical protein